MFSSWSSNFFRLLVFTCNGYFTYFFKVDFGLSRPWSRSCFFSLVKNLSKKPINMILIKKPNKKALAWQNYFLIMVVKSMTLSIIWRKFFNSCLCAPSFLWMRIYHFTGSLQIWSLWHNLFPEPALRSVVQPVFRTFAMIIYFFDLYFFMMGL